MNGSLLLHLCEVVVTSEREICVQFGGYLSYQFGGYLSYQFTTVFAGNVCGDEAASSDKPT